MSHNSWVVGTLLLVAWFTPAASLLRADEAAETKSTKQPSSPSTATGRKTPQVIPVFSLHQAIGEAPVAPDPFQLGARGDSLKDLLARLDKAGKDDSVAAVVVFMGPATMGSGQLEELHGAIRRLRAADKPVYAYADSLSFSQLALLSAASRVSVMPVGDVFVTGLFGSRPHLRGLLDKIQVTPDFLTCGDYKSAAEMFMRKQPSPQAARMYDWLFDSIFDTYVSLIADGRNTTREEARKWIDQGIFSAEKAAAVGLVDAAESRTAFLDYVRQRHGSDVRFNKKYQQAGTRSLDLSNPFAMFQMWTDLLGGSSRARGKNSVGLVYVVGPIFPGRPQPSPFGSQGIAYSDPIRRALDKVADDDTVKAVVLRVDSPGGSAVASEIILQATVRVAAKKPLIVSMGNVAGSGGYYVSCGANTIFADAATLTASIGVVAGKLATDPMWSCLGINWHNSERGENAGIFFSGDVFTEKQRAELQSWMDEIYEVFQQHVVNNRGDRLTKPIDEIAGGRVFTGRQALELGLVDRLGSLSDAIVYAAEQAGIEDYDVRVVPRPKNMLELMFSGLAGGDDDDDTIGLGSVTTGAWQTAPLAKILLPELARWEPQRVGAVRRALIQLEVLQRERLSLAMPEVVYGQN